MFIDLFHAGCYDGEYPLEGAATRVGLRLKGAILIRSEKSE